MYAVIESGGKQYRVELGSEIQVDRLDVKPGDNITLDRVLLVADGEATAVGRPVVDGATVSAHVVRQERGDKVIVFKYKPKARTRVKKGARAELTRLRIADIAFGGKSAAKDAQTEESRRSRAAREAEKAAAEKAAADQALAARLGEGEASTEGTTRAARKPAKTAQVPADAAASATETAGEAAPADVEAAPAPAAEASADVTAPAGGGAPAEAASSESPQNDDPDTDAAQSETRKDD